jgi:hypothetical protein
LGLDIHHERRHLAFAVLAHEFAALLYKLQRHLEGQCIGRNERRVFTQAVPGRHRRLHSASCLLPEYLEAGDVVGE